jgi:IS30 family transposase
MKFKHFSIEEREKLQLMRWEGRSIRQMARELGRSPSSVSREFQRSFPPERKMYTPRMAHERALGKRRCRGRKDRLKNVEIRAYVISHLKQRWSPEQISGRMKKEGVGAISHEAIYQFVYANIAHGNPRRGFEDLRVYLRRKRKLRQPHGMRKCRWLKPQGVSIELRPRIVNERKRVGDWESDTVVSSNHRPGINTLVERKTGLLCMTKLKSGVAKVTAEVVRDRLKTLPRYTITFDNGKENFEWKKIEKELAVKTFFAHPYCSGERGTNENTNGLIRQYFPKKTDFTKVPDDLIKQVEYDLNTRPRKRLNWLTPLEALSVAIGY